MSPRMRAVALRCAIRRARLEQAARLRLSRCDRAPWWFGFKRFSESKRQRAKADAKWSAFLRYAVNRWKERENERT